MTQDPYIKNWNFNKYKEPAFIISTIFLVLVMVMVVLFPNWLTFVVLGIFLAVWALVIYFFRDPSRSVINQPGLVVGPCDGVVVAIEHHHKEFTYLKTETIRVSIFLSLFDVHVQRVPLAGKVTLVDHKPGKFLQAFRPEASEVNEFIAMRLDTPFGNLLVKQIAGILARRCMNYAQPDECLKTGQRFGHIKFGSRVDLFLPLGAELNIKVGQKIFGGLTPVAQLSLNDDDQKKS